jgi:hypothetical protein
MPDYALPPSAAPAGYPEAGDPIDHYARATAAQESGGNYRALGPVTESGDRAFGKYQVMGKNIRPWTKQYYGRELTPTEFLNNPEAQEAVYRGEFGRLVRKHGPDGAARAWFAGERGMNNPNARDILGTTVSAYADNFNRNLPPEITAGTSRPPAEEPTRALGFDATAAVQNLAQPELPAAASGIGREQLAALYKNPLTRPVAQALLQKQFSPDVYDFKVEGGYIVRTNKRDGTVSLQQLPKDLMKVGENERIYNPNTGTWVGGGGPSDAERYGKLGTNERWKDPNDKSKGAEPIPGSAADKIGDEVAARIGIAKSFLSVLPQIRQRIDRGDVGIDNTANHAKALANLGTPGETARMMDDGAEALLRLLTGAGVNHDEAVRTAKMYRLTPQDTNAVIKSKMDALERHLYHIGAVLGQGRGGKNLLEAAPDRGAIERELRSRGAIR